MSWIIIVLAGHFLAACAFVIDKILLTKAFRDPVSYAFFIGLLGSFVFLVLPWGVSLPTLSEFLMDILSGALFVMALPLFFIALQSHDATRIIPFVGGGVPVFTMLFEVLILRTHFSFLQIGAFVFLVVGTIVITIDDRAWHHRALHHSSSIRPWTIAGCAALFFALAFGVAKITYASQDFLTAFVWSRLGGLVVACTFLFFTRHRTMILQSFRRLPHWNGVLFLTGQGLGAGSFVLINYAISLTSVSLVNALQGVQYGFLLVFVLLASIFSPRILRENMTPRGLVLKIIAVLIIGTGLALLAFYS